VLAHLKAVPQRGGTSGDLFTLPKRNEFVAKLGYMKRGIWEHIAVFCPTPKIEMNLMVYRGLYECGRERPNMFTNAPFWPDHCMPIHFRHIASPQIRKVKITRQRVLHPFVADVHMHVSRGSSARVLHREVKIHLVIADHSSYDGPEEHKSPLYVNKGDFSGFVRMLGLNGAIFSAVSGYDALIGSSFHFDPLQASVVGVPNEEIQSEGIENQHCYLERILNSVALGLFVIEFWFIYSSGSVEGKAFINVLKVLIGVVFLFIGWVTEQAALNLMDFGRIDWKHLF
jgi:hypothetical protein